MSNNIENIELRSEIVQEILSNPPHWMIRWGNIILFILIILLLMITWFIKYPDIIVSEAIITTEIPPQKEYAKITGKIDTLFISNHQKVKKNLPLAILENTANYSDVFLLKSIIDTIQINKNSFSFPLDSLPLLFLGDIDSDFALFENNYIEYSLNKEMNPFYNQEFANKVTLSELKIRLSNLINQKGLNQSELFLKQKELERNQLLFEKGVISAQDHELKQLEFLQAKRNFLNLSSLISQLKESISNAQYNSKGTKVSRVKEEMILLKNVIQALNQLKKSIMDWELRYVLKSDINGKVLFLNNWNENQTVNQGDLVFTIIPSNNSSFIGRLRVPPQNSGKIKVGQKVHIKLENYPEQEFGFLNGTVKSISLIQNKDGFYLVDVSLPKELITSYNKKILFKQEMIGVAEIITEDLRLIERFFYQLITIFN